MANILEALKWRYATKQYDTVKKLSTAQLDMLIEAMRLSPSSQGLQPWRFIVVSNPEVRARLRAEGGGQPQMTDASQLIVFAIEKNLDEALVEKYLRSVAETRGVGMETLTGYRDMLLGSIKSRSPEQNREWATRQVYIALGVLLATAAHEGIDASPMEGFDPKKFDEILGLEAMGLESKVLAAVGFRSPTDKYASLAKVRFARGDVVVEKQN
jgi:nitroreductase / dihydropteridine reductase